MKKDIPFYPSEGVHLAVAKKTDELNQAEWYVCLINRNASILENVIVVSKGYGYKDGEQQKTSALRHLIPEVKSGSSVLIEPIDPSVFPLTNEFWVSYFIGKQIYDKKFVFVPDTIVEENLSFIEELGLEGILHP